MILELDCGNSFIKWRIVCGVYGRPVLRGIAAGVDELLQAISAAGRPIDHCRMVSVRGDAETASLVSAVGAALGVDVSRAVPSRAIGAVINGYRDFERLGMDRWLAIIGAYHLCGRACLVIDTGTAVTVDFVGDDGRHMGGYIAPGIGLMREQLLSHTRKVYYGTLEAQAALSNLAPGRSTAEAVERGCVRMMRAYIKSLLDEASTTLGENFDVFVTGGDAALVVDLPGVTFVPDLVFDGLAVVCP
ncbi:type III pantothenate kinase [Stutzerimonas chloritidismutans]|uniref:type III pantothenate kinase n=1 Tax=Stutzerimonas chloritidismutans TaxID=203192 RepID=UPI003F135D5D